MMSTDTAGTITGLHACVDCVMVIANGDTSGISDYDTWVAGVESIALWEAGTAVMACDEDCDGEFRTDACDYCGSRLHGDRHPIAIIPRRHHAVDARRGDGWNSAGIGD